VIPPTANRNADEEEVGGGFMRGLVISCCFWQVQQPSQQGSCEEGTFIPFYASMHTIVKLNVWNPGVTSTVRKVPTD
jgi:hypothetical protein